MRHVLAIVMALLLGGTSLLAPASSVAQSKGEVVIGVQCDRTGPTQIVGTVLCPGLPRLRGPGEQPGRGRGPQDQGPGGRPRVQGAARGRVLRALQEGRGGVDRGLRHPADLRAGREADRGSDPGHLAGVRQRGRGRRDPLSVHLPDRRDLLVAGHRRGELREEGARRQPEGQEDRVHLLRQSGGPRADPGARGSGLEGRVPAQAVRGAASGRRDGRAGARHRAALPGRLRDLPPVRRRSRGVDQGAQAGGLSAAEDDRVRVGLRRGQHRGRGRLRGVRRATTPCSSRVSGPTIRC